MPRRRRSSMAPLVAAILVAAAVAGVGSAPAAVHAAEPTIDGQASGTGAIAGGATSVLQVTGRGGVPSSGVGAVALNVTVTNPTAPSYLTVYPTGAQRPTTANVVFGPGDTIPNMAIVDVGDGGTVSIFNYGGTADVVVDVLGWFDERPESITPMNPVRLLDTRADSTTVDGKFAGKGPVGADAILDLKITNRGGAMPASGIGAVVLSVTVVDPTVGSFLTVFGSGDERPTAANLNYVAGQSVSNMVMSKVGQGGQVSLYNYAGDAHLVVDVLGWIPNKGSFTSVPLTRVLDTRPAHPTVTKDYVDVPLAAGGELTVDFPYGLLPDKGAEAVVLNVTVTNPTAASYLTVWPQYEDRPTAANLNWSAGETVGNMVIVKLGRGDSISLYNFAGDADVVVDVLGYFRYSSGFTGVTPARLMDTR